MRSKLFVPGCRTELFEKALASPADAISFDLEDSVPPEGKEDARLAIAGFLKNRMGNRTGKLAVVRVNHMSTGLFMADVWAVVGGGVDLINIPKVESAREICVAATAVARAEKECGFEREIGLLANIETPRGLRMAAEIASADPRVRGLQIGYADLFEPFGIERDAGAIQPVRLAVRLAAAEAGIAAYDGALAAVGRPDLFRSEAEAARRVGFAGKSCIHPSQIAIANEVFTPRGDEIAWARKVIAAAGAAEARGSGAFVLDGQMIDLPFVNRARALLSIASGLGLEEREARFSEDAE